MAGCLRKEEVSVLDTKTNNNNNIERNGSQEGEKIYVEQITYLPNLPTSQRIIDG